MRRLILGWLLFSACGLSGCLLNRGGNGADVNTDAGRIDSGVARLDGGRVDASRDAATPPIDAGRDAGPRDAGRRDAGRDAGPRDSGLPAPTCDSVYGGAKGYVLCAMPAPDECEFFTEHTSSTASCRSLCMDLTGNNTCVRRWRDGMPMCTHADSASRDCDQMNNDQDICVCTL